MTFAFRLIVATLNAIFNFVWTGTESSPVTLEIEKIAKNFLRNAFKHNFGTLDLLPSYIKGSIQDIQVNYTVGRVRLAVVDFTVKEIGPGVFHMIYEGRYTQDKSVFGSGSMELWFLFGKPIKVDWVEEINT